MYSGKTSNSEEEILVVSLQENEEQDNRFGLLTYLSGTISARKLPENKV